MSSLHEDLTMLICMAVAWRPRPHLVLTTRLRRVQDLFAARDWSDHQASHTD